MTLKINIKCGTKKLIATINNGSGQQEKSEENDVLPVDEKAENGDSKETVLRTVGDLRRFIGEEAGHDPDTMKIIFRGKFIGTDCEEPLSNYNFKDNEKLIAMGSKMTKSADGKVRSADEDSGFNSLIDYEKKHLVALNEQYDKNGKELTELEKNFLEGNMVLEMIHRMDKQLKLFNEISMRHMENIDGLHIFQESTSEEQKAKNRDKRKSIINGIQNLMNLNDKYLFRLSQYQFTVEHPDEGH